MDPQTEQKLKKLEALIGFVDKDFVTHDEFVPLYQALSAAIEEVRAATSDTLSQELENFSEILEKLETGFKTRLGATNADVGNKASKDELRAVSGALEAYRKEIEDVIADIQYSIPQVPEITELSGDQIAKKLETIARPWVPVEAIKGGTNLATKDQLETAIIEIGGKLTVLEKRNSKGYGELGGGSEGTGSLFLSRLRDVDLSGLTKVNGKWILGSGSGGGGISDIAGLIEAGDNVTLDGSGTLADPYVINSSGSGSSLSSYIQQVEADASGGDVTIDLTQLSPVFTGIEAIQKNGQTLSEDDPDFGWTVVGNVATVKNAATTDYFHVIYTSAGGGGGGGGGGGFTLLPATGALGQAIFTFTEKPDYIVSDGAWYRENIGWTWSSGTATMVIPPNDDIFGFGS